MSHLWILFNEHCRKAPGRTALVLPASSFTYGQVGSGAMRTSQQIRQGAQDGEFVGLFAQRSYAAYAGMLGILHAGKAYVPLHPEMPAERQHTIALSANMSMIIADEQRKEQAEQLAASLPHKPPVYVLEEPKAEADQGSLPASVPPLMGDHAYMLFTSGSTGVPKGVPIRHANVTAYLSETMALLQPGPDDRFSQLFELTFDLSVHDIFLCWAAGATLCVPPKEQLLAPAKFVRENAISCWFSVPSVIMMLDRMRLLKPNAFPTLRIAAFCGEPLAATLATSFAHAAPNARVINMYGPTEATIAITQYELPKSDPKEHYGILSIGKPFSSAKHLVLDKSGKPAPEGELLLGGPQVTQAYWNAPENTAKAFVSHGANGEHFYRTGDQVKLDTDGDLLFLGRIDHQVKVRGHRIELEEINHVLRSVGNAAFAYSIAHPVRNGIATGIVSFLPEALQDRREALVAACTSKLPEHMHPTRFVFVKNVPFNTSGKADLKALAATL